MIPVQYAYAAVLILAAAGIVGFLARCAYQLLAPPPPPPPIVVDPPARRIWAPGSDRLHVEPLGEPTSEHPAVPVEPDPATDEQPAAPRPRGDFDWFTAMTKAAHDGQQAIANATPRPADALTRPLADGEMTGAHPVLDQTLAGLTKIDPAILAALRLDALTSTGATR